MLVLKILVLGEDIKKSHFLADGKVTTPDIWKKYGHLVDSKHIPSQYISSQYKPDHPVSKVIDKYYGFSETAMKNLVNPYAFPLMADSLGNLPPAFVLTCNLDTLRDDGILYAQRLENEGTTVQHYMDKHGFHGMMSGVKGAIVFQAALEALEEIIKFIEEVE